MFAVFQSGGKQHRVSEGDVVKVKVLEVDGRGKIRLSMKRVDQETGEEIEFDEPEKREKRGYRDERPRKRRSNG